MAKIVKFTNGKYGVRTGLIFKKYIDLVCGSYQWGRGGQHFLDCQGTREQAEEVYNSRFAKEEKVV